MEFHGAKAPHDFQPCVGSPTVGKRQGFLAVGPRDRMENYTGLWPRAISRPLPGPEEPKTLMLPRSRDRWVARKFHGAKAPCDFQSDARLPTIGNANASSLSGPGMEWRIAWGCGPARSHALCPAPKNRKR